MLLIQSTTRAILAIRESMRSTLKDPEGNGTNEMQGADYHEAQRSCDG
jgi:hypothetical protein